ncbi:MAG: Na+/H+ antiporter NhaA [Actinomycetota bacterium]
MTPEASDDTTQTDIRMPWARSGRRVPRLVVRPLQQFLQTEASSGILLLVAAAGALVWANVWPGSYQQVWGTELTVGFGDWSITEDLQHWINDAAMALFFFVVGLEIKRELISGELRDPRAAALPAVAALGGMVVPAAIYAAIVAGGSGADGWGIPMATDIAFAVGVLALVGRGLPSGLKLFLLTLAIVDDVGAIIVIAVFYSDAVSATALIVAAGLLLGMVVLRRLQVRAGGVYLVLGIAVWVAVFESGVHATIAGVALAFVTPAAAFQRPRAVSEEARRVADETSNEPEPVDRDAAEWLHLAKLSREAISPLARLEHALHPWTSFVIVPLFALANAGLRLRRDPLSDAGSVRIALAVAAGLVLGKIAGITGGALLAARLRLARIPAGVETGHLVGVAAVGGIGFTVSLFIASLAFPAGGSLDAAKLGILGGSLVAGIVGTAILRRKSATVEPTSD